MNVINISLKEAESLNKLQSWTVLAKLAPKHITKGMEVIKNRYHLKHIYTTTIDEDTMVLTLWKDIFPEICTKTGKVKKLAYDYKIKVKAFEENVPNSSWVISGYTL